MTADLEVLEDLSERYLRFAVVEAQGNSPLYERLATFASHSPEILKFLASLPADRRQPNLFLAAVRHVAGVPQDGDGLAAVLRERAQEVRHVILTRTTQTNEPARCAVLLPLLAQLPQPLALLEVGASAGLCLLPDRYGYDYGATSVRPTGPAGRDLPVFLCRACPTTPVPSAVPEVVWRAGLDLNPIDVHCEADVAWLETLVWPGQEDRARRLWLAVGIARRDPPPVRRGDIFRDLEALASEAPQEATLVVFHSAVLSYVPDPRQREEFAAAMIGRRAVWISNEAPNVFPTITGQAPEPAAPGSFLLAVNGAPVAWTGPHGQSIDWLESGRLDV